MRDKESVRSAKKKFNDAIFKLAVADPVMHYIIRCYPIYYVDAEHPEALAQIINDRYIVIYKDMLKYDIDDWIAVLIHEVLHAILQHTKRAEALRKKEKDIEYDVFNKLFGIAADTKVDNYIRNMITEWRVSCNPRVLIKSELSIDVDKATVEDIYYHLKKNAIVIDLPYGLDLFPRKEDWTIKDNMIIFRNNTAFCLNEGKESIRRAKDDSDLVRANMQILVTAKTMGRLPGFLDRYLTEILSPKVDWRILLRQYMTSYISRQVVTTWKYPSRRVKDAPGYKKTSYPRVWVFIDESGSISQKEFNQFMSEVIGMLKYVDIIRCIVWDVNVRKDLTIKRRTDIKVKFKGGGGTEFYPVISKYYKQIKPYDVMVTLTDGYWFDEEKSVEIIKQIRARKILVTTEKVVQGFNKIIKIKV